MDGYELIPIIDSVAIGRSVTLYNQLSARGIELTSFFTEQDTPNSPRVFVLNGKGFTIRAHVQSNVAGQDLAVQVTSNDVPTTGGVLRALDQICLGIPPDRTSEQVSLATRQDF